MHKPEEKPSFKDKTVWITGAKRIGKEIAINLASLGADLVISYKSSEKEALEVSDSVKVYGTKVLILKTDVTDKDDTLEAARQIKKEFGKLDILILMASIFRPVKIEEIQEFDWEKNFSTHVKGTFWPIQASLSLFPPGSHIVTVSDRTALGTIYPGFLPYTVTKSAVAAMTKALAAELGPRGIFINSIAPGPVLKPDDISSDEWQKIRAESIIKYPITDKEAIQEFVETVVRLCRARSSGSTYPLDFGYL